MTNVTPGSIKMGAILPPYYNNDCDDAQWGKMMTTPTEPGVDVFINGDTVKWMVGVIAGGLIGAAGWTWRLAVTVEAMRNSMKDHKTDVDESRKEMRDLRTELKNDAREIRDEQKSLREDLPSRSFIEAQFLSLTQRMDRLLEVKRN